MGRLEDDERQDAAGVGPYPHGAGELKALRDLDDWEISEGSADIRGWQVVTLGGRELGRVEDLLVDVDEHEVVMFTIDLKNTPRTARAPLRLAEIDRDAERVRIDSADIEGVTASDLAGAERAADERDVLDRDDPEAVRRREEREREERERIARRDAARAESERMKVRQRDRIVERDTTRDADRVRADEGHPVERVIERRPVVVEETVVRRRTVDPDSPEAREAADAELHRDKPGETLGP
jgi:hypothetical protein